jgi:hypothetical protein
MFKRVERFPSSFKPSFGFPPLVRRIIVILIFCQSFHLAHVVPPCPPRRLSGVSGISKTNPCHPPHRLHLARWSAHICFRSEYVATGYPFVPFHLPTNQGTMSLEIKVYSLPRGTSIHSSSSFLILPMTRSNQPTTQSMTPPTLIFFHPTLLNLNGRHTPLYSGWVSLTSGPCAVLTSSETTGLNLTQSFVVIAPREIIRVELRVSPVGHSERGAGCPSPGLVSHV